MGIRTKANRSASRRSASAAPPAGRRNRPDRGKTLTRTHRPERPNTSENHNKTSPSSEPKQQSNGITSFGKALRFLASLSDFERLRIVRYNATNFDLDCMRLLLKKLGNPQDQF